MHIRIAELAAVHESGHTSIAGFPTAAGPATLRRMREVSEVRLDFISLQSSFLCTGVFGSRTSARISSISLITRFPQWEHFPCDEPQLLARLA